MTGKAIGTRARVERITSVEIALADGEVPDMEKRYNTVVIVPRSAMIEYVSVDGQPFEARRITIGGPRRLAGGGASTAQYSDDSFSPPNSKGAPEWVGPLVARHVPAPVVVDDLPIVPAATDLDGS